jgi:hypothetical protein
MSGLQGIDLIASDFHESAFIARRTLSESVCGVPGGNALAAKGI